MVEGVGPVARGWVGEGEDLGVEDWEEADCMPKKIKEAFQDSWVMYIVFDFSHWDESLVESSIVTITNLMSIGSPRQKDLYARRYI